MKRLLTAVPLVGVACLTWAAGGATAVAAAMPDEVIQAARVVCRQDFEAADVKVEDGQVVGPREQKAGVVDSRKPPSPALRVDPKGKVTSVAADFQVPGDEPAYIVFEVAATKPGRLIVHVQPAELPEKLKDKVQEKDWADPRRHLDFRALVDLRPGKWQRYAINLNTNVFEAITREKVLFDLAGLKIRSIGFEVNQPGEKDQQALVDNVCVVGLTGPARRNALLAQLDEIRSSLEELAAGSPVARYWRPRVAELAGTVMAYPPDGTIEDWRELSGKANELLLVSHKWQLPAARAAAYIVGTETSLRRVSGRNAGHLFGGRIGEPVRLDAARHEYESFQIVILPLTGAMDAVALKASDLKRRDGDEVIKAENIQAFHQIEQYIQPSLRTTEDQVGWTPDALLPVKEPFDVPDVATKAIWVNVYVPADAAPGEYGGHIVVKPADAPEQKVELVVKVHDFAIPRVGRFRTQGHFALNQLQEWYGEKYTPEVRKAYYRLMLEHRFTPNSQYSRMLSPEQDDIDWVMRDGGNVILIGGYAHKDLEPEKITGWYEWLVEKGYIDQAIIYIGDETDDFNKMRAKAVTIRRNWPKLRIMVGGSKPRPELIGYCDVWDPITQGGSVYDFEADAARAAVARGEEMFWYTCIGPRQPYANVCNDDLLTAIRALWWQAWKYGITGFEYWWFNYWGPNMELSKGEKPWPLSRTDEWNSRSYAWCNGDGLWVYPGPDGQPLSSVRFGVVRDAVEDWEALFLLARAADLAVERGVEELEPLVAKARKILDVPAEITTDLTHWSEDPRVYLRNRLAMYEALGALREKLGGKALDEYTERWVARYQQRLNERFTERVARSRAEAAATRAAATQPD